MKPIKVKTLLFFIFLLLIGVIIGTIIGVNQVKTCQVYPASECPDCICEEQECTCEVQKCICEEVDCVEEIIKEQAEADLTKEKIKKIYK